MSGFHRRRRAVVAQWPAVPALALLWMLLWGGFTWANLLGGLAIGTVVVLAMPMPSIDFHGTVRPWRLVLLLARFHWDLVRASVQVATLAFDLGHTPRGAIIGVQLRSTNDLSMTLVAELSSLVPGSLVVEAHRLTGTLYLHVLDVDHAGGLDRVRADTRALEARVLRTIATTTDLEAVGLREPRSAAAGPATGGPT